MGKKKPKQPPAPDPTAVSNAQTASNQQTAVYNAALNRTDQYGPTGSSEWVQTGVDPTTGAPQYANLVSLSPEQRALYEQSVANSYGMGQFAGQTLDSLRGLSRVTSVNGGDLDAARQQAQDAIYRRAQSQLDPRFAQQQHDLENQLANEGLMRGSEAWNREMENFNRSRNSAYQDASDASITGGNDYAYQQFGMGLQNANLNNAQYDAGLGQLFSLAQGSQPSIPSFGQGGSYQAGQTDTGSNVWNSYQAQQNQANAAQATQNANNQGLYQLGAAAISAWSDRRLKTDIRKIGDREGLTLYEYRLNGSPEFVRGYMSDEVRDYKPTAVKLDPSGYDVVDYSQLPRID